MSKGLGPALEVKIKSTVLQIPYTNARLWKSTRRGRQWRRKYLDII